MVLVGAAAILVVLLVAGYFAFSGSDAPPAIDQTATTAAGGGETAAAPPPVSSDPTPASPVAQDPPPATPPAPPPAETAPTEADAAAAKADTLNQQIATALRNARRQLQDGDRAAALATAEGGLRLRANDRDLMAVVGELTSDARTRALAAKSGAEAFGGHATSLPAFRDAEARVAEADRSAGARRLPEAARAFWQAEELFTRAATDGRTAKDAADREAAAAAAAAPPPPVAKPAPPPPPAVNPDETAIRALMQRYADAYTRSDANAVASVTTLQASALRRGFDQLSSQRMQLTDLKITLESAQRARVECQLVHEMQPKAGAQNTVKGPATFVLEKRNGAWIVLQRR
jgi:ketosteroid isomerase-like protein